MVGLGKEDDFKDLDLTGKLALINVVYSQKKIADAFHHMVQQDFWSTIMWKDQTLEWQLEGMRKRSHLSLFTNFMGSS